MKSAKCIITVTYHVLCCVYDFVTLTYLCHYVFSLLYPLYLSRELLVFLPLFSAAVKTPKTAQPGTALAVQGMQKLLNSSESFVARDYERAAQQIVERYATRIDNVDAAWRQPQKPLASPSKEATPGSSASHGGLTPDFSQALNALNNLGECLETVDEMGEMPSNVLDESRVASQVASQVASPSASQSFKRDMSQRVRFECATQSYYNYDPARGAMAEQIGRASCRERV